MPSPNPLCPNCGYTICLSRKSGKWHCKRKGYCNAKGKVIWYRKSISEIEKQMKAQYPKPEIKYPEAYPEEMRKLKEKYGKKFLE